MSLGFHIYIGTTGLCKEKPKEQGVNCFSSKCNWLMPSLAGSRESENVCPLGRKSTVLEVL
jgi:hypothetical protein